MCRKTMDMKQAHIKPDCLRRIVSPRCGLGLLRDSVHQNEAFGPWRSDVVKSTIGKYTHRDKKRARSLKLARKAKEMKMMEENTHAPREETRATAGRLLCQPPPGAMAPANTTQYLMSRFYDDFQERVRVLSLSTILQQRGEPGSSQNTDTTLDREEACLSFQQRDFEEQFGALW